MAAAPRLAVMIATLDHPRGLSMLLEAIERQEIGAWAESEVAIVVADNSALCTALPICDPKRSRRFAILYVHEGRRGVAHARNACLAAAIRTGARYGAFIDDDEIPEPTWLIGLHAALTRRAAAACMGPVRPLFEGVPPPWIIASGVFHKSLRRTGETLDDGYTCNAMVDLAFVSKAGLAFDARFNATGGEDTMFFRALRAAGGAIVWAEIVVVHDAIPHSRMSRSWLVRRWFRTGGIEAEFSPLGSRNPLGRLHNLARGGVRVLAGGLGVAWRTALRPTRPGSALPALFTLSRGAGLIAAACGWTHAEYRAASYRRSRS